MTTAEFLLGDDRRARLAIDAMPAAARAAGPRRPPLLVGAGNRVYGIPDVVTSRAVPPGVFLLVDDAVRAAVADLVTGGDQPRPWDDIDPDPMADVARWVAAQLAGEWLR